MKLPLKVFIPLVLIVMLILQSLYIYSKRQSELKQEIFSQNQNELSIIFNMLQDNLEFLYSNDDIERARELFADVAADPYIKIALFSDHTGEIITSNRTEYTQRNDFEMLAEVMSMDESSVHEVIDKLRLERAGGIIGIDNKLGMIGSYPVILGVNQDAAGSDRVGALVFYKDMSALYKLSQRNLAHDLWPVFLSSFLLVLLFIIIFHQRVFLRLSRLEAAAKLFASGQQDIRLKDRDVDELGLLAGSFDKMAETIEHDQVMLKTNEQIFFSLAECSPVGMLKMTLTGLRSIPLTQRSVAGRFRFANSVSIDE